MYKGCIKIHETGTAARLQ